MAYTRERARRRPQRREADPRDAQRATLALPTRWVGSQRRVARRRRANR